MKSGNVTGTAGPALDKVTDEMLRFDRIEHLLAADDLRDKRVVQIGLGSGGAPVNQHLVMNGVRRWMLFDPDRYDEVNLVKHPQLRAELGELKAANQKKWILDRNPDAEVEIIAEDVMRSAEFQRAVKAADLVLCCTDTPDSRLFVNSVAVKLRRPCITGSVFRRGFGGEVYSYVPSASGCYDCMLRAASELGFNMDDAIDLLPIEEKRIYGLNFRDFKASGLSLDIQAISIIHARMALDILLSGTARRFDAVPANWVIFYNRRVPNVAASGFLKCMPLKVKPRNDCVCSQNYGTEKAEAV